LVVVSSISHGDHKLEYKDQENICWEEIKKKKTRRRDPRILVL
jgi:hypothetical protein